MMSISMDITFDRDVQTLRLTAYHLSKISTFQAQVSEFSGTYF